MLKTTILNDRKAIATLFVFSFLFVFFNSKNSPLYLFNEWGDANIYFSMGKGMMNGLVPYRDLFDHKGPLIFLLYGLAYLIDGDGFTGIYLFECIFLFINLLFAYKLALLYLSKPYAFAASLVYAVLIFNKTYYGGSAEEFISVFVTVSFYYFVLHFKNREENNKHFLIHGAMFTLAFLAKLSVCVFWVPLIFILLWDCLRKREYRLLFKNILYFYIGTAVALVPFIIYFALNEALYNSYWGYIQFNSIYAEFQSPVDIIKKTIFHAGWMLKNDPLSFPLTLLGVGVLLFGKKYIPEWQHRIAILLSFALSFVFVSMSKYVMTYAHIVLYIYAIFGVIFLLKLLQTSLRTRRVKQSRKFLTSIYSLSFIICLSIGIYEKKLFGQDVACLLRQKECSYMQKEFADIIRQVPHPTLLDLGLDHGVYTKAGIVPTYKYFFYPNIPYRLFPDIRDEQEKLLTEGQPTFVVVGNISMYYQYFKELPALNSNYELVATYEQNIEAFDSEVYLYKRK